MQKVSSGRSIKTDDTVVGENDEKLKSLELDSSIMKESTNHKII